MPARTKATPTATKESLQNILPKIFDQAQGSTANHQKNYVALYKLQSDLATHVETVNRGNDVKLVGERAFEDAFLDMINRILPLKKGVTPADRIVKFVGGYVKFLNEKAMEDRKGHEDEDEDEDTTASRFTARLLKYLLKGFPAKDKAIRYRSVRIVAEMVSHLGEIDEDSYISLRSALFQRIQDKEAPVRVQAVIALSKLCGSETPDDLDDSEELTATDLLVEVLAHDPAADVRRAALLNLPLTPANVSPILARTRDTDPLIRKVVYSTILETQATSHDNDGAAISPAHPRALTIEQRELIVRNGLGDREGSVRAAAARVLGTWVDVVRDTGSEGREKDGVKKEGGGGETGPETEQDLIAFLKMFDLVEGAIAEDALLSVLTTRVDVFDSLEFGENYWRELTPEKAFLGRVFAQHCISTNNEARLEGALPVVTAFAFQIQAAYNDLLERVQLLAERRAVGNEIEEDEQDEQDAKEFILGEMLRLAVDLDYGDEIGRRKMFQLVRDMISQEPLPDSLVTRCLDVLRKLSPNERDLIRLVVEVVQELRDPPLEEEEDALPEVDAETTFETPKTVKTIRPEKKKDEDMTPEEHARKDAMDLRCLDLCIGMLERVMGTFEENSTLEGILGDLIIPAVKRKEMVFREKGLISLGLCCLIARRMALNSFQLFLGQIHAAPEPLRMRVIQVVFDIMMVHEGDFLGRGSQNAERIVPFLLEVLNKEESEKVTALIVVGLAKLAISGMVTDERVLKSLLLTYMSPETADNQEVMQCLSYFFPLFIPVFLDLVEWQREAEGEQSTVGPAQMVVMLIDWTDPQKAIEIQGQVVDELVHVDLAGEILKALFSKDLEKENRKVLCQVLGKLYLPEMVDDDKIRTLKLLVHNLRQRRPLKDTAAQNAIAKFEAAITKKFEKQLEGFDEDEYRQLEQLKELFEFLDDIIPDDDEEIEMPKKRATRKRRSDSVATTVSAASSSGETGNSATPVPSKGRTPGQTKAKRRKVSNSSDDSDEDTTVHSPPFSSAPRRSMPRRSAASKKVLAVESSTSDEDEDEAEESTPPARQRKPAPQKKSRGVVHRVQEDESEEGSSPLSGSDGPADSIMDSSSEGE
ncbi:hypothetical protein PUNSTDRAFT_143847 [Punctularia strigosozonata HHB-11173 SS5]|uniref:uncharacterized protein n=1 Tax=Punctularia strigosozonata (strain HHB-11173) TaxID=741275 RepID=UPI000441710E|nr:uncharacterized protein PUNSTDRAFT_143847 [Punctularia strigosozonata HHB-11173 SS5]EIN08176.1 hypothetical protein PUNSTDRAFT_143847 [Punctularia strigosozonata HHB-11173 SS5]